MSDVPSRLLRETLRDSLAPPSPSSLSGCLDAEVLAAWSDGTLSRRDRATAESHAATCERCQAMLAAMATIAEPLPARKWWQASTLRWLVPIAVVPALAVVVWMNVPAERQAATAPPLSDFSAPSAPAAVAETQSAVVAAPAARDTRTIERADTKRREQPAARADERSAPAPAADAAASAARAAIRAAGGGGSDVPRARCGRLRRLPRRRLLRRSLRQAPRHRRPPNSVRQPRARHRPIDDRATEDSRVTRNPVPESKRPLANRREHHRRTFNRRRSHLAGAIDRDAGSADGWRRAVADDLLARRGKRHCSGVEGRPDVGTCGISRGDRSHRDSRGGWFETRRRPPPTAVCSSRPTAARPGVRREGVYLLQFHIQFQSLSSSSHRKWPWCRWWRRPCFTLKPEILINAPWLPAPRLSLIARC